MAHSSLDVQAAAVELAYLRALRGRFAPRRVTALRPDEGDHEHYGLVELRQDARSLFDGALAICRRGRDRAPCGRR